MSRREWPLRFQCNHEGCTETVIYHYPTRRDLEQSFEARSYKRSGGWQCIRHSRPNEVLGPNNLKTEFACISGPLMYEGRDIGITWVGAAGAFIPGPGFRAWAKDFPPGTKLTITAQIDLPPVTP